MDSAAENSRSVKRVPNVFVPVRARVNVCWCGTPAFVKCGETLCSDETGFGVWVALVQERKSEGRNGPGLEMRMR